jgi:uncharacterized protein YneR
MSTLSIPGSGYAQGPVHVDPLLLGRYVGQYELSATYVLTIVVESDRLYVRAPGRGTRLLIPASETEFIEVESGLRIMFGIREDTREVDHLVFEQQGFGRRADKVTSEVGLDPETRPAMMLSDDVLSRYVGEYEEQPGFGISISKDGDQLLAQMTDQAGVEIFAESETEFFYRDTNTRISFRLGNELVEALILHQGGVDLEMRRLD